MNLPEKFENYIESGIVKKGFIDKFRAKFLVDEAEISLKGLNERLDKIGINANNANSIIKDCYDLLMELIRAKMLKEGYSASGNYAHEAEISYLKKLDFSDNEIGFLNDLRYFRNSITYYGKILNKEYAEKVLAFMKKIYPRLKAVLK